MHSTSTWVGTPRARGGGPVRRARRRIAIAGTVALGVAASACAGASPDLAAPSRTVPPTAPAALVAGGHVSAGTRLGVAGCPLFPVDHAFHADVRTLPVSPSSGATIAAAGGAATPVTPGFTNNIWDGSRAGIPVNVVDPATAVPTNFAVAAYSSSWSTATGVPMPRAPRFEGWPGRAWDRHLLLVDPRNCTSRELINVQLPGENLSAPGSWYADAVDTIDLRSTTAPPAGVTASGLSMLSGLVRYDEVAAGDVGHALSISLPNIRRSDPVWPAQGTDGRSSDPAAPPMGTWFRLRADADLSRLGPQARVVARALQVHGAVLADTGPRLAIGGEPDVRWDDADLATLAHLDLGDLQVVDPTPMRATSDPSDLRIR